MYTAAGRIVVKESGNGIPDLLVVVFDFDPGASPEESIAGAEPAIGAPAPGVALAAASAGRPGFEGNRLGSVLTDADGRFSLTFEDADFQIGTPKETRPDLILFVLAPEEPGLSFEARTLYMSGNIRQGAARSETYLIRLPSDLLTKAQIAVPSAGLLPGESTASVATRLRDVEAWQSQVVDGSLAAARLRVDQHRARFGGFKSAMLPAIQKAVSRVPDAFHDASRYVAPGESVFAKSHATIQRGLREQVNTPASRRKGILTLTDAERAQLQAQAAPDGTVSADAVAALRGSPVSTFVQRSTTLPLCGASDATGCLAVLDDTPPDATPAPPDGPVPGTNVTRITSDDIPRYMARIMETMSSPESELLTGLMPTASQSTVDANIHQLAFHPSPADVPAFHDFNQLQIAFQHVWQEAIDEGLLGIAENAYHTIVELGGSPDVLTAPGPNPFGTLIGEAQTVLAASRVVRDHRGSQPMRPPGTAPGGGFSGPNVRDHRGDATTPSYGTESLDPVERLPALLVELQKRLQGSYAFTTYAANRKERSVNFGILNTYRQTWTPLTYQAGALVKSIPLAPKQTQKVTITRKTHRKRSVREVENNLRSMREETSETSRSEEEIARRASSKTTFSLSNTASADVEVGSDSATTTFSQEAAKSSDDVKKSFHEAVFKAAQEVKQERTTEVNSEESEDDETVETTEIGNPNDEIAVTFLFYELQRRYRVAEHLYRVRPVVLVAQEIPAPHDIDLDWLVAHDWILKRAILDDSFVPVLDGLTQAAGEETALAELKMNVEQQRAVVNELREEVAIARRAATLQSALLEQSVYTKAGATTGGGGGGGGIFGFVSDAVGEVAHFGEEVVGKVGDLVFGGDPAANQSNRQAMEDAAQRAADQARDLMFRMEREVTALNALMESYAKALREHYTRLTEIARLEVHVMDNILYYMQAIWNYEPPDQRFFRLHQVPVPTFKNGSRRVTVDYATPVRATVTMAHEKLSRFGGRVATGFHFQTEATISDTLEMLPLVEVADLDTLLGYKGNYMIFPLRESNALTDFMMDPYVDRATGALLDPSAPDLMSLDEFADYVCCLKKHLTAEEFAALRADLQAQYRALLTAPQREDDVLVVPTNSLFIEAIPSEESLMEPYKKAHRLEDVKKVQAEVRAMEMENIRRAARLLADERGDPNIDKRVVIQGGANVVVDDM